MSKREPVITIAERKLNALADKMQCDESLLDGGEWQACLISAIVQRIGEIEEDIRNLQKG